jgi:hypothetical protein
LTSAVFLEHVRSHVLAVALVEEALNPVMVALEANQMNRRTAYVIKRSGVEVLSIDRWFAGSSTSSSAARLAVKLHLHAERLFV